MVSKGYKRKFQMITRERESRKMYFIERRMRRYIRRLNIIAIASLLLGVVILIIAGIAGGLS